MSSATILVVDDDSQIRRVMRNALSSHGYTIIEARNGEEALKKVRAERLDLIILDLNMPDMDGIEVCREIRVVSNLPIIMLTVRSAGPLEPLLAPNGKVTAAMNRRVTFTVIASE